MELSRSIPVRADNASGDPIYRDWSQSIRTATVHDFDALTPYIPAWDRLAWEAAQNVPTLLPGWVDAFLRHQLRPNESWFCSFAYIGDRLIGVLPVIVTPHLLLGRHWPQLRTPYDKRTTHSGDVVLAPDCAAVALKALLAEAAHMVPSHSGLDLKAVRCNSPVWLALRNGADGYLVRSGHRFGYWFLDVQGDSAGYWANLCKMRQNLRRSHRRLEKRGAISVEMKRGSSANENFLAEFLALEASGWKGRMGTAILNDPNLVAFYTTLVRNFANQGQLEWHGIRVDGRLIAGQLAVRCGKALILPRYAYDEDFAECSPGHLLTEEVIEKAFFDREVTEINIMSSAHQCSLWHMAQDSYIDVHLVRQRTLPVLFNLPQIAARKAYHDHVRPRIPITVKQLYRRLKRIKHRKP
ncbi:GNAT family N-acetyltransferase [Microvirga sp. BT689]|uniref:GNAT family N-acetyltransferase n=1 Tax=Microvirga arvi TaxID=2778731 RepID=UPI00194F688E|nr:GNAT family N-acetyltransferase [Microvirga arvi]MBM6584342.1 GNAT family N-acetyltransferase [Microvirga arvi]